MVAPPPRMEAPKPTETLRHLYERIELRVWGWLPRRMRRRLTTYGLGEMTFGERPPPMNASAQRKDEGDPGRRDPQWKDPIHAGEPGAKWSRPSSAQRRAPE